MTEKGNPEFRELGLEDMIRLRRGGLLRRFVHALVSITLRLFFRRIETANADRIPEEGASIFVMNHPNGLIDPALIFVTIPRSFSFLAKSTLFDFPVLGRVLRLLEALPVYRRMDAVDVSQNEQTFAACIDLLARDGAIALFPEGVSHSSPKLLPIKTGAARIAIGTLNAIDPAANVSVSIVPVGLFYTSKTTFRSEALIWFGEPFAVPDDFEKASDSEFRDAVNRLSERISMSLRELTVNAESDKEIETAAAAANLFFSVSQTLESDGTLAARFSFVREYLEFDSDDSEGEDLTARVSGFKRKLRALGLRPENLELAEEPVSFVLSKFIARVTILLAASPIALLGTVVHFPAYQLSKFIATRYTHHGVDDIISTVKVVSGMVLMPLSWFAVAVAVYWFTGSALAMLVIPGIIMIGYIALRWWEEFVGLRGWFKAVWLLITRRKILVQVLRERRRLLRSLNRVGRKE
ncbi:MAG: lysophospholipid acyltransferase family protein [Pyrinomonadaceae bacterium]